MKVCTKCKIDKELDQYEKYFHSTQQKERIRGYCNSCLKEQKRLYKESIKIKNIMSPVVLELQLEVLEPKSVEQINLFSTNPDYKKCKTCSTWKLQDEFHFHSRVTGVRFGSCKECQKELDRIKYYQELEDKGGSDLIPSKPNEYKDKYQKEQTFMVMQVLGYIYNEDKGIWLKLGTKELVDGKIVFSKVSKENKVAMYLAKIKSDKVMLMKKYRDQGLSYNKIAYKLNVSETTVFKYLNAKTD